MNKNIVDDEEMQRIVRAAQAVRMGMNMHHNDTRPGLSFFDVFVKTFIYIIIGLLLLGIGMKDKTDPILGKIQPYLDKWQAYEDAKHQ
jgi:hypothetical protein